MSTPESRGHLRKEDWFVYPISEHSVAVEYLRHTHYAKGAANTSIYRHGLYRNETELGPFLGELKGVAMWMIPTKNAAQTVCDEWKDVLCLSRFAVSPGMPTNAASFLLSASMRLIDRRRWPVLLTYADTALGHTGTIYKATNWRCLGPVSAGDTWVAPNGVQRGRKRAGKNLLISEMIDAGFVRRPAAPKIKFVHQAIKRG